MSQAVTWQLASRCPDRLCPSTPDLTRLHSVASLAASLSLRLNATTYRYTAAHTFSYDGGSLHVSQRCICKKNAGPPALDMRRF